MGVPVGIVYFQSWPSPPPTILAKKAPILASRLPFNMSVTSLQDISPREVASLAMAYQTLRSTVVRSSPLALHQRRPGSPFPFPFPLSVQCSPTPAPTPLTLCHTDVS